MLNTYKAPGIPTEKFLLPEGLVVSVQIAEKYRDKIDMIISASPAFQASDIHWLSKELDYHLLFDWRDDWNSRKEIEMLKQLRGALLQSDEKLVFRQVLGLIDFMRGLVMRYGEMFYQKMLSFEAGEKEDDCWNNRMYQSSRLGECILIWIRLGIDSEILELWKSKLREDDADFITRNILPLDLLQKS
ncbi:MAG: hypothetical protein ACD_2C00097G0005 [uncultured bacterium (gcode 4)]|uniref:Uncharacterized protein n=1 Tax=uncultured bacterium (gcode 4) TaxID=1234023 RepID=K2G660_9BACT|nr:MAG: hypothetical protein ACD_2C00097G0005 [uncultured bacterium (gcode 4)]